MALKIGQQAPAWSGINQHGEHIDSSQFLGKKVILFFYTVYFTVILKGYFKFLKFSISALIEPTRMSA